MKIFAALAATLLACSVCEEALGQMQPPVVHWSVTVPFESAVVTGIATDQQGSLIVGSRRHLATIGAKQLLTKYDDAGSQLWQKEVDPISGLTVDEWGNTYLAGNDVYEGFTRHMWLGKYSPNGTELWKELYPYDYAEPTSFRGLVRDQAGNFYSTGGRSRIIDEETGEYSDSQIVLTKLSPTGEPLWIQEFGTPNGDFASQVAIDANQNIYVAGMSDGMSTAGEEVAFPSVLFSKFDPAGNVLWERSIEAPGYFSLEGFAVDDSGNVFIGGSTEVQIGEEVLGENDLFLGRWDSNGNEVWLHQFGSASSDTFDALTLTSDNKIIIAGETPNRFKMFKQFNFDGEEEWGSLVYDPTSRETITNLVEHPDGRLYATEITRFGSGGYIKLLSFPATADFDNDGDIDGRDFLAWQRGFGKTGAALADGDANGDFLVNDEDLAIWQDQYQSGQLLAANVPVPEPSGAVLALALMLFAVRGRTRILQM